MKTAVLGIVLSVLAGASAQLMMKYGLQELPTNDLPVTLNQWLLYPQGPALIFIGIGCYVLAVFTWMLALKVFALNAIYPILALGYAVVYVAAAIIPALDEPFTLRKTAGVALIIFGVIWSCSGKEAINS